MMASCIIFIQNQESVDIYNVVINATGAKVI